MFKKFLQTTTVRIFDPMPLPKAYRIRPTRGERTSYSFTPFVRKISKIS